MYFYYALMKVGGGVGSGFLAKVDGALVEEVSRFVGVLLM